MYILLPPSEAKRPGGTGPSLTETAPVATENALLRRARNEVARDLGRLLRTPRQAAEALYLPASVAATALEVNRTVATAPTRPALDRYAGVVYDGLDAGSLSPSARELADAAIVVFSGLFGVVGGAEPVPDYRVPAKARLPRLGILATYWRARLPAVLAELFADRPVLDLRSSDYASMWQPDRTGAHPAVTVRVLSRRPGGSHGIVSYTSKFYKGKLARQLVLDGATQSAADPDPAAVETALVQAWLGLGGLDAKPGAGAGRSWDLYVD